MKAWKNVVRTALSSMGLWLLYAGLVYGQCAM